MLTFIFLLSVLDLSFCENSVHYVAVVFRHGDRTPISPYPTDPWRNESLWPFKFGELTNTGIKQHFALGQWFRKKYSGFLSKSFDPSEIYIRSTDLDRTLMSAQANLAGLYPPVGKAIWNKDLLWKPIPVHTVPEVNDEILAMKKPCIAYDKALNHYMHSAAYIKKLNKYKKLMQYLTLHSGEEVNDFSKIAYIYSDLYIETLYNFTLPNWTHAVYPEKMRQAACYSFKISTATPLMARLKVGPLLKDIVNKMKESTKYRVNETYLKFSMYSAHDLNIGGLLNGLNLYDGKCPVYTSTIIMELLYDNITNIYSVRLLYRNSTEIIEPYNLYIPGCGQICPLERFLITYDNLVSVDWDNECKSQLSAIAFITFVVAPLMIFTMLYVLNRYYLAKLRKRDCFASDLDTSVLQHDPCQYRCKD